MNISAHDKSLFCCFHLPHAATPATVREILRSVEGGYAILAAGPKPSTESGPIETPLGRITMTLDRDAANGAVFAVGYADFPEIYVKRRTQQALPMKSW